jgi:hypothetical protein
LAVFALYTLSESHALQANNIFWIIYVAVAARLALDARARSRKVAAGFPPGTRGQQRVQST